MGIVQVQVIGRGGGRERERGRERESERASERERERTSLFPWDYVSLGLGVAQTRCFFKMARQLPVLSQAFRRFAPAVRPTGLCSPAPPSGPPSSLALEER